MILCFRIVFYVGCGFRLMLWLFVRLGMSGGFGGVGVGCLGCWIGLGFLLCVISVIGITVCILAMLSPCLSFPTVLLIPNCQPYPQVPQTHPSHHP